MARWATRCDVGVSVCVLPLWLVALRVMWLLLLRRHLWRRSFGCRLVAHSQYAMCVEHVCMWEVLI